MTAVIMVVIARKEPEMKRHRGSMGIGWWMVVVAPPGPYRHRDRGGGRTLERRAGRGASTHFS
jgi:hypothetical protein